MNLIRFFLYATISLCFQTYFDFALVDAKEIKKSESSLKVMSYNVENLFDWEHDAGKEDWAYLPQSVKQSSKEQQSFCAKESASNRRQECTDLDWNKETVLRKALNISQVIKSTFEGAGPDVVVLLEVENIHALSLIQDNLQNFPYLALIEGPDKRGIDVGLISRYPIIDKKLHQVDLPQRPTRGILQVDLNVNGKQAVIFGNHWPSQNNPDENRMKAGEVLIQALNGVLPSTDLVIAVGDFNTADDDDQNALKTIVADSFFDAQSEAILAGQNLNAGTHIFKGRWVSLDKMFIAKKFDSQVDWSKFSIYSADFLLRGQNGGSKGKTKQGQGLGLNKFNPKTGQGYSDHLPLLMEFSL